jgi:chain length determinant protein (polysaccharide antigen chain regulator)
MLNSRESNGMGEIDISDIIRVLWKKKWMIFVTASVVTLIAVAYVFLVRPIYEASAFAMPPTYNDIANLNYGRSSETELVPVTVKEVYSIFLQSLKSETLRQTFIAEVMASGSSNDEGKAGSDLLYSELSKRLIVSQPRKDLPDEYMVTIQSSNPDQAAQWAQEYIHRAGKLAEQEIIKNISYEADVKVRSLDRQIADLRENGQKVREDTITKLREALRVAKAIGLEKPPIIAGNPAVQIAGSVDGQLIYMRGTKALEAEIENLEARSANDPFIGRLRDLESKQAFYKSISSNLQDVVAYRLDGDAKPPLDPIKPKRALIIMLGFLFGVLLGVGFALVHYFLPSDSSRSSKKSVFFQ